MIQKARDKQWNFEVECRELWWEKGELEVLVKGTYEESVQWTLELWICFRRWRVASENHQRKTEDTWRKMEKTRFLRHSTETRGLLSLEVFRQIKPWATQAKLTLLLSGHQRRWFQRCLPISGALSLCYSFPNFNHRNMIFL